MKRSAREGSVLAVAIAYNVADAAAMLGIGQSLLYDMIAQGRVPVIRIGKRIIIRRESLERWLQEFEETEIAGKPVTLVPEVAVATNTEPRRARAGH